MLLVSSPIGLMTGLATGSSLNSDAWYGFHLIEQNLNLTRNVWLLPWYSCLYSTSGDIFQASHCCSSQGSLLHKSDDLFSPALVRVPHFSPIKWSSRDRFSRLVLAWNLQIIWLEYVRPSAIGFYCQALKGNHWYWQLPVTTTQSKYRVLWEEFWVSVRKRGMSLVTSVSSKHRIVLGVSFRAHPRGIRQEWVSFRLFITPTLVICLSATMQRHVPAAWLTHVASPLIVHFTPLTALNF